MSENKPDISTKLPDFRTQKRVKRCLVLSLFRLLIFSLVSTFHSCGFDVEDPHKPSPPLWVEKSLPEEWPERGIDAHESGGIFLEWEPDSSSAIVAHLIYRARYYSFNDSLGDYSILSRVESENTIGHSTIDASIESHAIYYYKLRAVHLSGIQSSFSDSINFSVGRPINTKSMNPNGFNDSLLFGQPLEWRNFYVNDVEDYCLTILNMNDNLQLRTILQPSTYIDAQERWFPTDLVTLNPNEQYMWRIDVHNQYVAGIETSASESNWATFLYID
jgi:hypothetical protein